MKKLEKYTTIDNKIPFDDWFKTLDRALQTRVDSKILKLDEENFSDCSILKNADEIREARIRVSSGLRIYYQELEDTILLLLIGGDKKSQKKDIEKAIEYWQDYKQRKELDNE